MARSVLLLITYADELANPDEVCEILSDVALAGEGVETVGAIVVPEEALIGTPGGIVYDPVGLPNFVERTKA